MYTASWRDVVRRDLFGPAPDPGATGRTGSSSGWPWSSSGCSASASTSAAPSTCRPPAARSSAATTSASSTSPSSGLGALPQHRLVRFMAKSSVFDHWFAGPFMRAMQHIPVDRKAGAAAFEAAVRALKDGEVVGVFPEATISTSFTVKDLKAGAARMAVAVRRADHPGRRVGRAPGRHQGQGRAAPRRRRHRDPRRADRRRAGGEGAVACCAAPGPPWRSCSTRRSAATPSSPPGPTTAGGCPPTSAAPRPRPRRPPPRTPIRAAGKALKKAKPSPAARLKALVRRAPLSRGSLHHRRAPSAGTPPARRRTSGGTGPAAPCPAARQTASDAVVARPDDGVDLRQARRRSPRSITARAASVA